MLMYHDESEDRWSVRVLLATKSIENPHCRHQRMSPKQKNFIFNSIFETMSIYFFLDTGIHWIFNSFVSWIVRMYITAGVLMNKDKSHWLNLAADHRSSTSSFSFLFSLEFFFLFEPISSFDLFSFSKRDWLLNKSSRKCLRVMSILLLLLLVASYTYVI